MPYKSNGSQMDDDIRLQFGQQRAQPRPVGKVDLTVVRGLQGLAASAENFIASSS